MLCITENDLRHAAFQSRLPSQTLSRHETSTIGHLLHTPTQRTDYIKMRNVMLSEWHRDASEQYTLNDFLPLLYQQDLHCLKTAVVAFHYLHRYRLINYGLPLLVDPKEVCGDAMIIHKNEMPRLKLVIVGAGMAGVTTARELRNLFAMYPDYPVPEMVILEASDRTGGRIHSYAMHNQGTGGDAHPVVDLGAQIITGLEGNPLTPILTHQLQLPLHFLKFAGDTRLFDQQGRLVPRKRDQAMESLYNDILDKTCHTYVQNGDIVVDMKLKSKDVSCRDDEMMQPTLYEAFQYHLQQHPKFAKLSDVEKRLLHWHMANLEFANGGMMMDLSLHHWDQDDEHVFGGFHCMVRGGLQQMVESLAKGHAVDKTPYAQRQWALPVLHNKVVTRVKAEEEGCEVVCADGSVYACDAVVMTASLGALKANKIAFEPALPSWKQQAMDRLGFGTFNKVVLTFPRLFWSRTLDAFGSLGPSRSFAKVPESVSLSSGMQSFEQMIRGEFFLFW